MGSGGRWGTVKDGGRLSVGLGYKVNDENGKREGKREEEWASEIERVRVVEPNGWRRREREREGEGEGEGE